MLPHCDRSQGGNWCAPGRTSEGHASSFADNMSLLWWGHPHSMVVVVMVRLEHHLFGDTGGDAFPSSLP